MDLSKLDKYGFILKKEQYGSIKTRSTWIYHNKINMDLSKLDKYGSISKQDLTWIYQNKVNMDPLKQDHDKHGFIKTR